MCTEYRHTEIDASELITQREVVSQRVSELLTDRGETFGLILDDIVNLFDHMHDCILSSKFLICLHGVYRESFPLQVASVLIMVLF